MNILTDDPGKSRSFASIRKPAEAPRSNEATTDIVSGLNPTMYILFEITLLQKLKIFWIFHP